MGLGNFLKNQGPGGLSSYLTQLTDPTNPLGQIGKAVSQASGGAWGNALSLMDQQKRQQSQDGMQQQIQQAQLDAMNAKQNRNQIVQLPNGGIAAVDPDTNQINVLREPDAKEPHKPPIQEQIEYLKTLDPKSPEYQIARLGVTGAGNDPTVLASKFANAMALHQAPTYANEHPKTPGSLGGSRFGRTHTNPLPIKGEGDLANVPVGTWVSPAPGVVFQVR